MVFQNIFQNWINRFTKFFDTAQQTYLILLLHQRWLSRYLHPVDKFPQRCTPKYSLILSITLNRSVCSVGAVAIAWNKG